MQNAILFTNAFLSYLLLFVVSVAVIVVAVFIGMALRKRKNAKLASEAEQTVEEGSI